MRVTKKQGQIIVNNKLIPFRGFLCINLFGILFVRGDKTLTDRQILHERIHTCQQKELLWIFFYIWYLIEWVIRLFQYRFNFNDAYMNISFEREAYYVERFKPLDYPDYRPRYKFLKFCYWR